MERGGPSSDISSFPTPHLTQRWLGRVCKGWGSFSKHMLPSLASWLPSISEPSQLSLLSMLTFPYHI